MAKKLPTVTKEPLPDGEDLKQRAYLERQLIVVLPDEAVRAQRKAQQSAGTDRGRMNWPKLAGFVLAGLSGASASLGYAIVDLVPLVYKAIVKLWETGVDVQPISRTEARVLRFPPGHPRDGVLYIGHPAIADLYYTMSEFHRFTFEHKMSEAVGLLMSLGAQELTVGHVQGWGREFGAQLNLALPTTKVGAGAKAKRKTAKKREILFEAQLDGHVKPSLPNDLVWYPFEPTWQRIAEGRLKYGLKTFSLSVRYEDDFGVSAGLRLQASKAGLDVGGTFEDYQATVWRIEGIFGQSS